MKPALYIFFIFGSLQIFSQEFDDQTIHSASRSMLIELAEVESIELISNESTEEIKIFYKNTNEQNQPLIRDDGTYVHMNVSKNEYNLKGVEKNKYRAGQPLFPSYRISIPKGMDVKLLYDKGNLKVNNFFGMLDVRLNAGVVMIDQFHGKAHIESFSGKIYCSLNAARLDINSSKGTIVSSLIDKRLVKSQTSLKGIFNNAKNVLKINTIHAKVNLKSVPTQK